EFADGQTLDAGINPKYDGATGRFVLSNIPAGHYQLTANWFESQQEQHAERPLVMNATPVALSPNLVAPNVDISDQRPALLSGAYGSQEARHATLRFVVDAPPVDHLLLSAEPNVEISGQLP